MLRFDFRPLRSFLAVGVLGALGHFLFAWSGRSPLLGAFCAVNESTWEHMKLLFFPAFFLTMAQLSLGSRDSVLPALRAVSITAGTVLIPALFYTYSGVLGFTVDWVNILIFYLADAALFALDARLHRRHGLWRPWQQAAGAVWLWALAFLFVWYTFRPPHIALFQDPLTGLYGLPRPPLG